MLVNSYSDAHTALIELVLANLPNDFTEGDVKLPGRPFTTPNGSAWLRVSIVPTSTRNMTQGGYQRTTGILTVDFFYPIGSGSEQGDLDADEIIQALSNSENAYVKLFEAGPPRGREDDPWWMVQVDFNYTHEGLTHA